jgi:hypothetical protein
VRVSSLLIRTPHAWRTCDQGVVLANALRESLSAQRFLRNTAHTPRRLIMLPLLSSTSPLRRPRPRRGHIECLAPRLSRSARVCLSFMIKRFGRLPT